MIIWIIRGVIVVLGPIVGYLQVSNDIKGILAGTILSLAVVVIEFGVNKIPLDTLVAAGIGIALGFIAGYLLESGVVSLGNARLSEIMGKYSLLIKSGLVVLGLLVAVGKKQEIDLLDKDILHVNSKKIGQQIKILDTSVIIDGRIADVCETKFLLGPIILPHFVLAELHKLADSADSNKRVRARRGLEILKKLQDDPDLIVRIYDKDYPDLKDVDTKLIQLAKDMDGMVLTTDFNLNKIASLQGVTVLNVNDLANALKPIYLPGERMNLHVVKEGKERDQGVGYLDDGTMVIVEEGRRYVGKKIDVVVSSMLQTSAGRMIFTRHR